MRPDLGRTLCRVGGLALLTSSCQILLGIEERHVSSQGGAGIETGEQGNEAGSAAQTSGGTSGNSAGHSGAGFAGESNAGASSGGTAGSDSQAGAAGAVAVAGCDLDAPFETPVGIDSINSKYSEQRAHLSLDGKYLYFSSDRAFMDSSTEYLQGMDVYRATRIGDSLEFTDVTLVSELSQPTYGDFAGAETQGGLTLYFDAYRTQREIWRATRTDLNSPWASLEATSVLFSGSEEFDPALDPGAQKIFFTTSRNGYTAGLDIYWAPLKNGAVTAPGVVEGITTNESERSPAVSADLSHLYYAAFRQEFPTNYDIWVAKKSTADTYAGATRVTELNSSEMDYPTWLTPDGCLLFLSSRRVGSIGLVDIYVAQRKR